jgi:hypothetical protein
MNVGETKCRLCGCSVYDAAERGSYLKRVSPKGGEMILECRPSCDRKTGNQEDALMRAITDE